MWVECHRRHVTLGPHLRDTGARDKVPFSWTYLSLRGATQCRIRVGGGGIERGGGVREGYRSEVEEGMVAVNSQKTGIVIGLRLKG